MGLMTNAFNYSFVSGCWRQIKPPTLLLYPDCSRHGPVPRHLQDGVIAKVSAHNSVNPERDSIRERHRAQRGQQAAI